MNTNDAIYPSYQDLLSAVPETLLSRLHNALDYLQLEYGKYETWKSVFWSHTGEPSYYLVILLFAVFSDKLESWDDLFSLDETERSPPVVKGLDLLITSMRMDHKLARQQLATGVCSTNEEKHFVQELDSLISSRLVILRASLGSIR